MSERTFGVEIECGHPSGLDRVRQELSAAKVPFLSVGYDGSGVEVRTRVLKGPSGFKELKSVFTRLNDIGCYITNADGQHCHFGAADFVADGEARARLIESWVNVRPLVLPFVDKVRHTRGSCRDYWTAAVKNNIHHCSISALPYYRGDLNLNNLKGSRKTVEVRLHEGNLDYDKAEAWLEFWLGFLDSVKLRSKPFPMYKRGSGKLLSEVGVREEHKRKLRAARKHYKTHSLDGNWP